MARLTKADTDALCAVKVALETVELHGYAPMQSMLIGKNQNTKKMIRKAIVALDEVIEKKGVRE